MKISLKKKKRITITVFTLIMCKMLSKNSNEDHSNQIFLFNCNKNYTDISLIVTVTKQSTVIALHYSRVSKNIPQLILYKITFVSCGTVALTVITDVTVNTTAVAVLTESVRVLCVRTPSTFTVNSEPLIIDTHSLDMRGCGITDS